MFEKPASQRRPLCLQADDWSTRRYPDMSNPRRHHQGSEPVTAPRTGADQFAQKIGHYHCYNDAKLFRGIYRTQVGFYDQQV